MKTFKKLIEVALPLDAINKASAREKSIRHGHPSTLHLWWARRPLAAARAVIFAQMVDDPSAHPDLFPTEKAQEKERKRLFKIIEDLVLWENTTNEEVLQKARDEIWQSWRRTCAANADHPRAAELFDRHRLPAFHDPFAGGGALPLEAQRLGLESYASDLNPVAVLINKAMIEIPPRFAGKPPVNPVSRKENGEERSEEREERSEGGRDALSGTDRLAESDGSSPGGLSVGTSFTEGRGLRYEVATDTGDRIGSGEHSRRMDTGIGEGKNTVSFDSSRIPGRSGNTIDPLREGGMVSTEGNQESARFTGRDKQDNHHYEAKTADEIETTAPHSSFLFPRSYSGAEGLAEDVRYYGKWMRDEAEKRIGHLYPKAEITDEIVKERPDLEKYRGRKLTVIAWIWARTVKSPNPAFAGVDVPLASTFMLSTKKGKEAYVEAVIENGGYRFEVRNGEPKDIDKAKNGTKIGGSGSSFFCLISGTPIPFEYIRYEAKQKRMGSRLMAIVAEGDRGRVYLSPTDEQEGIAIKAHPENVPDTELPNKALGFRIQEYGMIKWRDLFTPRQLVALTTFSDLVAEAREKILEDARNSGIQDDGKGLEDGGTGALAYADAVGVYLGFAVDKSAVYWNSLCPWLNQPKNEIVGNSFGRQALPMVWDFAEANPFSLSGGNVEKQLDYICKVLVDTLIKCNYGFSIQRDATTQLLSDSKLVSTDPPYYDNIGYADLSDFFYIWLRHSQKKVFPDLFSTLSVPKAEELIATPYRHNSKTEAEAFFLTGMTQAIHNLSIQAHRAFPITIYYAFKQSENDDLNGRSSTGWETFLDAIFRSGLSISGTWPIRTERQGRMIGNDTNALASSIVLVCRKRAEDAPTATRREFVAALKDELPEALAHLQRGNIAPVDLAQAAIGPGMGVYTRYTRVLDAGGKQVTVREALGLINQVLDEVLAEQEGDFDADSRWALAWFEQSGFSEGDYGVAEVLSKAKDTSIAGMMESGLLLSKKGKVRLLRPKELPADWDPAADKRLTVWEMVHHLVRVLESDGEGKAAELSAKLGAGAETARELCYRLYTICERKKRAAEALSYNALVQSWPEITRLAREGVKYEPKEGELEF